MKKKQQEEYLKALKEMEEAKKELQKLQEMHRLAQEEVSKAKLSVKDDKEIQKDPSSLPDYQSQDYWESRYEKETKTNSNNAKKNKKSAQSKNSGPIGSNDSQIYEWYVPFEDFSFFLRRDLKTHVPSTPTEDLKVYIPGCGNSTLAEDLHKVGMRNIVAVDFSPTIIKFMNERTANWKLNGIKYKEANLFDVKGETENSYDLILDKGTLDAIASQSNTSTPKQQQENIKSYFQQMWKILKINGIFVIITTITEELLEPLITSFLVYFDIQEKTAYNASNWSRGHMKEKLTTTNNTTVYYYSIVKLHSLQERKELMMNSINMLLDEAKKITENDEWHEIEEKEKSMSSNVNQFYEKDKNLPLENLISRIQPELKMRIDYQNSQLFPNGFVIVEYEFPRNSWNWDENDSIRLVLSSEAKEEKVYDYSLYLRDENPFDGFEYLDSPSPSSPIIKGKIKSSLPDYGGSFHLSYVHEEFRQLIPTIPPVINTTPMNPEEEEFNSAPSQSSQPKNIATVKDYFIYQQTETILVRFPIFSNNPLLPLPRSHIADGTATGKFRKLNLSTVSSKSQSPSPSYELFVENMKTIRRLMIHLHFSKDIPSDQLHELIVNRFACWLYPLQGDAERKENENYEIFLEFDQIQRKIRTLSSEEKVAEKLKVEFLRIPFIQKGSSLIPFSQLDLSNAVGELESDNHIILRIPYKNNDATLVRSVDNQSILLNSISQQIKKQLSSSSSSASSTCLSLSCKFCDQVLLDNESFSNVHILPTGLLDDKMHEFVCCENNNCFTYNVQDMNIDANALYLNPFYLLLHRQHFQQTKKNASARLSFPCKENYCFNDLFHPMTSLLLSTNNNSSAASGNNSSSGKKKGNSASIFSQLEKKAGTSTTENSWRCFMPVLSMDSAFIRCGRCFTTLGDALITFDENDDAMNDTSQGNESEISFQMKDIQSMKFNLQNIKLEKIIPSAPHPAKEIPPLSVEKMLARISVLVNEKFSSSVFCLYAPESITVFGRQPDQIKNEIESMEIILIRIISTNFQFIRISSSSSSPPALEVNGFSTGVKISPQIGKMKELFFDEMVRVPVQHEEFEQMKVYLTEEKTSDSFLILNLFE